MCDKNRRDEELILESNKPDVLQHVQQLRDRIKELETERDSLKCCGNCKQEMVDVHNSLFGNCDDPCFTCKGFNLWEPKGE